MLKILNLIAILTLLNIDCFNSTAVPVEDVVEQCVGEEVSIFCPPTGCTIQVLEASNQHQQPYIPTCNTSHVTPTCSTNATDVWERCHEKVSCSFFVLEERPSVNCSTVSQFVTLKYRCQCPDRCEQLASLPRGQISYSSPHMREGTEAFHACARGFELVGPTVRVCEAGGKWGGIRPACSLPVSECRQSPFPVQTYGDRCYVLSRKGTDWPTAKAYCSRYGGNLARVTTRGEMGFVLWWLHQMIVYRYIWVDLHPNSESRRARELNDPKDVTAEIPTNTTTTSTTTATAGRVDVVTLTTPPSLTIAPPSCYELYRNDSVPRRWLTRKTHCNFQNQFICEYVARAANRETQSPSKFKLKDIALILGIALGVAVVVSIFGVTVFILKRRKRRQHRSTYDNVTDANSSAATLASAMENSEMTYENGLAKQEVESQAEKANEEGVYDDVYYSNAPAQSATARPAKMVRKPIRKALGALNQYENVVIHSLTESLKRKLRPRLFRRESRALKECDCIQEECSTVPREGKRGKKRAPPPPNAFKDREEPGEKCRTCGGTKKADNAESSVQKETAVSCVALVDSDDYNIIHDLNLEKGYQELANHSQANGNNNSSGDLNGTANARPISSVSIRSSGGLEVIDNVMYCKTNRNSELSTEI